MKNNGFDQYAARYAEFRSENRLRHSLWQQKDEHGKTYACALGALLDANDIGQAERKGCVASMMPEWLVHITPELFDHSGYTTHNYRIKWADALYMPGGCIDRANKLPKRQREKLYRAAEKEIMQRLECAYQARAKKEGHDQYGDQEGDFGSIEEYLSCFNGTWDDRVAGTIPAVLDELLTQQGA